MSRLQIAVLMTAATALTATGCASSKTGSTGSTAHVHTMTIATVPIATGRPLARAQLIAQGDTICTGTDAKIRAISAKSTAAVINSLPQTATDYDAEVKSLSKLVPPPSMSHRWSQVVNDIQLAGEYANAAAEYAKEKYWRPAVLLYKEGLKLKARWLRIAKRAGFKVC
jgi:hypothetical protein